MTEKGAVAPRRSFSWWLAALAIALIFPFAAGAAAGKPGHFTENQAQTGKQVYGAQCAACHGGHLQGGAGPALQGHKFQSSMKYGQMSTAQLYDFIAKHMPKNKPGSLSQKQYLEILAYLLKQNGFAAGSSPLDKNALDQVTLLPLPSDSKTGGATN